MKETYSMLVMVCLGCLSLAAFARQNSTPQQGVQALNSDATSMQTLGKVGETNYAWINGRAWRSLDDNAKIALVAGIEQGIVLGVRENWDVVPQSAQKDLVNTARELTVSDSTFTQLAVDIDALYLQSVNLDIPVVDAYQYSLLAFKKTPKDQLKRFLDHLRENYPSQVPEKQH